MKLSVLQCIIPMKLGINFIIVIGSLIWNESMLASLLLNYILSVLTTECFAFNEWSDMISIIIIIKALDNNN